MSVHAANLLLAVAIESCPWVVYHAREQALATARTLAAHIIGAGC